MNLNEYQEKARATRLDETRGIRKGYSALGLSGEAGEVADKVKKIIRGDFRDNPEGFEEHLAEIAKEVGDVLWYVAAVADDLDISLSAIAQANLDKLRSRQERDEIQGSGDNR